MTKEVGVVPSAPFRNILLNGEIKRQHTMDGIVTVPQKEFVELERHVIKPATFVERIIEVPNLIKQQRTVQVPVREEVIREIVRKQKRPLEKEVVIKVKRKDVKVVVEEKKVPGQRVEVPKIIENIRKVIVPRYQDENVPTIVAQTIYPYIYDDGQVMNIDTVTYEPFLIPVDVYIPKPVDKPILCDGKISECFRHITVPPAQYNLMLRHLNEDIIHIGTVYKDLPWKTEEDGTIQILKPASCVRSAENLSSMAAGVALYDMASPCNIEVDASIKREKVGSNYAGTSASNVSVSPETESIKKEFIEETAVSRELSRDFSNVLKHKGSTLEGRSKILGPTESNVLQSKWDGTNVSNHSDASKKETSTSQLMDENDPAILAESSSSIDETSSERTSTAL